MRRTKLDREPGLAVENGRRYPAEPALCELAIPGCDLGAPGAAVLRRLLVGASEQHFRPNACLPRPRAVQPVVRRRGHVLARAEAFLLTLDHAALAGNAADERVDRRTCDRRRLEEIGRAHV